MAEKDHKTKSDFTITAQALLERLSRINGISSKKMFGGHGLFHDSKMFGLIDSKGIAFLKIEKGSEEDYTSFGAHQHSRMPYYSIPIGVFEDQELLASWARKAISASK